MLGSTLSIKEELDCVFDVKIYDRFDLIADHKIIGKPTSPDSRFCKNASLLCLSFIL